MPEIGKVYSDSELAVMAKAELNEPSEKQIAKDLKALREWIKKQPHLAKTARQDDQFLLMMLRGCKFSLDRTKKKLESYNTVRTFCPEIFDGWDVDQPGIRELIAAGITVVLPGFDKHGRKVVVQRGFLADPKKFTPSEIMRANCIITHTWMEKSNRQSAVCGVAVIADSGGATAAHLAQFSPSFGKKMTTVMEEVSPARPKVIYMLNMPAIVESIHGMVKGLMKKKMQDRMVVVPRGDLKRLAEDLGRDVLPEEYGGTNGTLQQHVDAQTKEVLGRRDWLLEQARLKSDESRRTGIKKSYSDIFGMEGSFRQLEFD